MNKNIKVIDDHNIDRNANIMFALELEGSEYVVYSIERDTESNNVFVSKVLRDVDGTYNMLNIDETDKKEEVANIVKVLISTAVSNQNGKLSGAEMALSDGRIVKFVGVSFNKEQKISVQKTYITTVKKEVTNVAEKYYDVVQVPVQEVVTPVVETPVVEPSAVFPTVTPVVTEPQVVAPTPEPVSVVPELPSIPVAETPVQEVTPTVTPVVTPEPVVVAATPVVETPVVAPVAVQPTVVPEPVAQPAPAVAPVVTPVVEPTKVEPFAVQPTPVVPEPIPDAFSQPLVFNASKETNLNAALGEAADATNIPVESIQPVKEFGVDEPVKQPVAQPTPAVAPVEQPAVVQADTKTLTKKAGFANSKFFMVVAIAFFLASCIFLGYEVFNYFQLIK